MFKINFNITLDSELIEKIYADHWIMDPVLLYYLLIGIVLWTLPQIDDFQRDFDSVHTALE